MFFSPANADFNDGWVAFTNEDFKTASREWKPLAEKGDAKSQTNLGILYFNGKGVLKDYKKAIFWLKKAAEQGVDGLILVCAGAGGHAGTLSPFALVREVREFFDGTIILSGSISSGSAVASSLALGADLAYLGTRFIATEEANADQGYKDMLIDSVADDIVYSSLFTGVHGNYLKGSVVNAGLDPNDLPEADKSSMNFGSGGNTDAKAWKDIWGSGQGIGSIKDSPSVQTLVDQLTSEFKEAVEDLNQKSTY